MPKQNKISLDYNGGRLTFNEVSAVNNTCLYDHDRMCSLASFELPVDVLSMKQCAR